MDLVELIYPRLPDLDHNPNADELGKRKYKDSADEMILSKELHGSTFPMTTTITSAIEFLELVNGDDVAASERIRHCEAPEEVWLEIITLHPNLKGTVVFNKKLPMKVLEALSRDSDPRIRWWVAMKRKLSTDLIHELSKDLHVGVRQSIVFNASATQEALQRLSSDVEEEIATKAKQRLENGDFK